MLKDLSSACKGLWAIGICIFVFSLAVALGIYLWRTFITPLIVPFEPYGYEGCCGGGGGPYTIRPNDMRIEGLEDKKPANGKKANALDKWKPGVDRPIISNIEVDKKLKSDELNKSMSERKQSGLMYQPWGGGNDGTVISSCGNALLPPSPCSPVPFVPRCPPKTIAVV